MSVTLAPPEIVARLKRAGLLPVAERAAKRVDLRLVDCIAGPPEVTGGHRALWSALAREGKAAGQIAVLVGWPEAAVARELPAPVPPPPDSGPRVVGRAKPLRSRAPRLAAPRSVVTTTLPEQTDALIAAIEERIDKLSRGASVLLSEAEKARAELAGLRRQLQGVETVASTSARALAVAHLRAHGDDDGAAVEIAARVGVTPERLLSGSMQRDVCRARREIAEHFAAEKKASFAEIARMLNIGSSAVGQALRRGAYGKPRKEAA